MTFSIGQGINISFVYTLDAYGPVRGEVTIAQLAFKCSSLSFPLLLFSLFSNLANFFLAVIGFGLSATTNSWIAGSGELVALSEMAAIAFFVLALWIPMFFWGARLRRWSLGWRVVSFVKWKEL